MVTPRTSIILFLVSFLVTFGHATAQTWKYVIDAKSNIYGAGHQTPPAPSGGGGGIPPLMVPLPAPGAGFVTLNHVIGKISFDSGNNWQGPDGGNRVPGHTRTDMSSFGGISGIIHGTKVFFLVGVFLDNTTPVDPAPARLDFTGNDGFTEIRPALRQTFFIGDGLTGTSAGKTQKFHVPPGATRLFLGFADGSTPPPFVGKPGYYDDNRGQLSAEVVFPPACILGSGANRPGGRISFSLVSDPCLPYLVGSSLGTGPIPFDSRKIDLSPDNLLFVSVLGYLPWIFTGYQGLLDHKGGGKAGINIPNHVSLIGASIHTAFVTLCPCAPSGVKSISNTFSFTITK